MTKRDDGMLPEFWITSGMHLLKRNSNGALEATLADAQAWGARARAALVGLPRHPVRDMLLDLSDYVIARVS